MSILSLHGDRRRRKQLVARVTVRVALALAVAASPSYAELAREPRPLGPIDHVALKTVGDLEIAQGTEESLVVEAEPKVLARIRTTVSNGTLTIDTNGSFSTREPVRYVLKVTRIAAIETSSTGSIHATPLAAEKLRLVVSGSGEMRIDGVNAAALSVDASGAGTIAVASGKVDRATIRLTGAAEYVAPHLQTREASIDADGSAQAIVAVEKSLAVSARGSAQVGYSGSAVVTENLEGVAWLQRKAP